MVERLPPLKPLVLVLKQFLREQNLHQPFTGGLSSHALTLMVVSYLQYVRVSSTGKPVVIDVDEIIQNSEESKTSVVDGSSVELSSCTSENGSPSECREFEVEITSDDRFGGDITPKEFEIELQLMFGDCGDLELNVQVAVTPAEDSESTHTQDDVPEETVSSSPASVASREESSVSQGAMSNDGAPALSMHSDADSVVSQASASSEHLPNINDDIVLSNNDEEKELFVDIGDDGDDWGNLAEVEESEEELLGFSPFTMGKTADTPTFASVRRKAIASAAMKAEEEARAMRAWSAEMKHLEESLSQAKKDGWPSLGELMMGLLGFYGTWFDHSQWGLSMLVSVHRCFPLLHCSQSFTMCLIVQDGGQFIPVSAGPFSPMNDSSTVPRVLSQTSQKQPSDSKGGQRFPTSSTSSMSAKSQPPKHKKDEAGMNEGLYVMAVPRGPTTRQPIVVIDPLQPARNVAAASFAYGCVAGAWEDALYDLVNFVPTAHKPSPLSVLLDPSA